MATCPKCQLPNPDDVPTCIWCGSHRFLAASAEALPRQHLVDAAAFASPVVVTPIPAMPLVESIHTPCTTTQEQHRPLPSHLGLLLASKTKSGSQTIEPRTPATSPTAMAAQAAVATPPPSDTAAPRTHAKLVVLRGQKIDLEYPLYEGRNVIGRFADRPVDIDLVAQEAEGQIWSSRQHAVVIFDRNLLFLEDLNSLNGTWLNGARVPSGQKKPLKANDVIQIGTVQLKVVHQ